MPTAGKLPNLQELWDVSNASERELGLSRMARLREYLKSSENTLEREELPGVSGMNNFPVMSSECHKPFPAAGENS